MLVHSLIFTMVTQFGSIDGQVRDARTHMPIILAKVELSTLRTPVNLQLTGSDGRFRFVNIPEGTYSISVSYSGYQPAFVEVSAPLSAFPIMIDIVRRESSPTDLQPTISLREYLVPKSAQKEFDRARKEVTRRDCSTAIKHFENGLRVFDRDASAHNDLGNCYRQLGQLDRAEDSFLRAAALTDSVYVSLNLAEVFTAQKRFNEAEKVLLKAVEKGSNTGDVYYGLGLVYLQQERMDDAEGALLRADSYPHQIADVHLVLAEIYRRKEKPIDVFTQLERYLQEAPKGTYSQRVRQILKDRQKP
jgi:tetratricopeptide (TPR) repeat protein